MKIGDKIKTNVWSDVRSDYDYQKGKIHDIITQLCLDGSIFETVWVKFDDGRLLPHIKDEIESI